MSDLTEILGAIEQGDRRAAEELLPLVYAELRRLAMQKLVKEKPGQTLDATGLVHEAYLRLISPGASAPDQQPKFAGVRHFFGAAAEAMRRILTENARRKARIKHGGEWQRIDRIDPGERDPVDPILALDEALTRLSAEDAVAAKVVELHHFAGLSHERVADSLGITVYLARQKWNYARAWLRNALGQ